MYLRKNKNICHQPFVGLDIAPLSNGTSADISPLASRPMTWTDLLYMAAEDVVKDKHCLINIIKPNLILN